ncbi:hypothetical protein SEA_KEELAN_126 [Gordonia phage Keelan]|nr:hypothetical protein SEA_KEELAN_126 [Gordonia phage Keelan]
MLVRIQPCPPQGHVTQLAEVFSSRHETIAASLITRIRRGKSTVAHTLWITQVRSLPGERKPFCCKAFQIDNPLWLSGRAIH